MTADVVALLRELVAVDSANPSLVPGAAGERAIAGYVERWARDNGLSARIVAPDPARPSVVVRGGGGGGGRTLLLCGHLDTVGHGTMTDPLTPRVAGDRLYARGAYDMKAGLAAALIACRQAARDGLAGEVVVAAVADEEHASRGVRDVLAAGGLDVDAAIVTEPTELAVAVGHRGFVWSEIEVTGRAAHGSRPHLGVDAILKAGPVLVALAELDTRLRKTVHPLLGSGNLHGSLIEGGREESTIPDRCLITVERRTLPGETVADVERDLAELLDRCRAADPELAVTSRTTLARDPFETDPSAPVVTALGAAVARVTGRAPEVTGMSYWADSGFLAAAGIPTVLFGPGGDGAHAEVEWVSLADTVACADTLIAVTRSFCGGFEPRGADLDR
ncbi:M20/M25/M40 family metallo-hydrolase [Polymorphospora rubra]